MRAIAIGLLLNALDGALAAQIKNYEAPASQDSQSPSITADALSFFEKSEHRQRHRLTSGEGCQVSTTCDNYPFYDCQEGICEHKDVFPQEPLEIVGLFVFGFIMALCTVAGIGGGGIANSMLLAFWKFETKNAVAISSFSILVCTTMRFFYNFRTKNPEPEKKHMNVLDYGLATVMMPTTLAGSQLGGYILLMFPSLIIQIMLTLLLAYLSYQTSKKGLELHAKEVAAKTQKQSQISEAVDDIDEQQKSLFDKERNNSKSNSQNNSVDYRMNATNSTITQSKLNSMVDAGGNNNQNDSTLEIEEVPVKETNQLAESKMSGDFIFINEKRFDIDGDETMRAELKEVAAIAQRESGQAQFMKQGICTFILICVVVMNSLLPTQSNDSRIGIKMCSAGYWIFSMSFVAMCGFMTWYSVRINSREQKLKMKYGINYREGDIVFEGKTLTILLLIGFMGGLVAGALGLGGGSIYNPALLSLGVHPKVSGATGMFLVLYSTINTCFINWMNGLLYVEYACWISTFSLLGSVGGMMATDKVVQMTGKPSVMVWVLVFVFIISTISTPTFAYFSLRTQAQEGDDIYAFNNMCNTTY